MTSVIELLTGIVSVWDTAKRVWTAIWRRIIVLFGVGHRPLVASRSIQALSIGELLAERCVVGAHAVRCIAAGLFAVVTTIAAEDLLLGVLVEAVDRPAGVVSGGPRSRAVHIECATIGIVSDRSRSRAWVICPCGLRL